MKLPFWATVALVATVWLSLLLVLQNFSPYFRDAAEVDKQTPASQTFRSMTLKQLTLGVASDIYRESKYQKHSLVESCRTQQDMLQSIASEGSVGQLAVAKDICDFPPDEYDLSTMKHALHAVVNQQLTGDLRRLIEDWDYEITRAISDTLVEELAGELANYHGALVKPDDGYAAELITELNHLTNATTVDFSFRGRSGYVDYIRLTTSPISKSNLEQLIWVLHKRMKKAAGPAHLPSINREAIYTGSAVTIRNDLFSCRLVSRPDSFSCSCGADSANYVYAYDEVKPGYIAMLMKHVEQQINDSLSKPNQAL